MCHPIRYLLLSDIHLGHNKNRTENIIKNLDKFICIYKKQITAVDIIFITGDVFERLLTTGSNDSQLAYGWLSRLLMFCKRYKIKLRILEGTPDHDWKQVNLLYGVIDELKIKDVDFKYFDTLNIEIMNDLGLSILYLPDEYSHDAKITYTDVKKIMKKNQRDKVDLVIMHGSFNYQLPGIENQKFHNEKNYIDIVNYTVNCGHVHFFSIYDKIIVPGSFDRLDFGDVNTVKGGVIVTLKKGYKFSFKILPNNDALEFYDINYNENISDLKKELLKYNNFGREIHIRINADKNSRIHQLFGELKLLYPYLRFAPIKDIKSPTLEHELILDTIYKQQTVILNKKNLKTLVYSEIDKLGLIKEEQQIISEEIESLLI